MIDPLQQHLGSRRDLARRLHVLGRVDALRLSLVHVGLLALVVLRNYLSGRFRRWPPCRVSEQQRVDAEVVVYGT